MIYKTPPTPLDLVNRAIRSTEHPPLKFLSRTFSLVKNSQEKASFLDLAFWVGSSKEVEKLSCENQQKLQDRLVTYCQLDHGGIFEVQALRYLLKQMFGVKQTERLSTLFISLQHILVLMAIERIVFAHFRLEANSYKKLTHVVLFSAPEMQRRLACYLTPQEEETDSPSQLPIGTITSYQAAQLVCRFFQIFRNHPSSAPLDLATIEANKRELEEIKGYSQDKDVIEIVEFLLFLINRKQALFEYEHLRTLILELSEAAKAHLETLPNKKEVSLGAPFLETALSLVDVFVPKEPIEEKPASLSATIYQIKQEFTAAQITSLASQQRHYAHCWEFFATYQAKIRKQNIVHLPQAFANHLLIDAPLPSPHALEAIELSQVSAFQASRLSRRPLRPNHLLKTLNPHPISYAPTVEIERPFSPLIDRLVYTPYALSKKLPSHTLFALFGTFTNEQTTYSGVFHLATHTETETIIYRHFIPLDLTELCNRCIFTSPWTGLPTRTLNPNPPQNPQVHHPQSPPPYRIGRDLAIRFLDQSTFYTLFFLQEPT
ncbi:MAG: hypothetical protein S4CHLAM102_03420 [Chlamydiia bacterium]|nr:hypothetical protein [Chlamydiia bacterium]